MNFTELSETLDHIHSVVEAVTERSSLKIGLRNTQIILFDRVPLKRSCAKNVHSVHHGDLRRMRQIEQIKSTQIYDKW